MINRHSREAISANTRKAADLILTRLRSASAGANESKEWWGGKDDRYFEGFEDGITSAGLHVQDALQAFFDGELLSELTDG